MKKIIVLLGLCFTFYACDGNSSAAKELITEDIMEDMDGEGKIEKIKVKKISEGDDHWSDEMSDSDLAFYHSTIEVLFLESGDFNEGDKVKFKRAFEFFINDDEKPIEIYRMMTFDGPKIKKKGESTWEDIN